MFTGKERDTELGNDYMFARYYDSATGRFLSPAKKETPNQADCMRRERGKLMM